MTFDAYAMFPEGSYHIAHGNCQEHALDVAEHVCKNLGIHPNAYVAGLRGELKLNCEIFNLDDLKSRA